MTAHVHERNSIRLIFFLPSLSRTWSKNDRVQHLSNFYNAIARWKKKVHRFACGHLPLIGLNAIKRRYTYAWTIMDLAYFTLKSPLHFFTTNIFWLIALWIGIVVVVGIVVMRIFYNIINGHWLSSFCFLFRSSSYRRTLLLFLLTGERERTEKQKQHHAPVQLFGCNVRVPVALCPVCVPIHFKYFDLSSSKTQCSLIIFIIHFRSVILGRCRCLSDSNSEFV